MSMLADSDTVWVPTLVTVRNLLGCGRYDDEVLRPIIARSEELVHMAFEKEIKQLPGVMPGLTWFLMEKGSARNMNLFARF